MDHRIWAVLGLAALAAACERAAEAPLRAEEPPAEEDTLQPALESIQEHVFGPHCLRCHSGTSAPQGLRLDDAGTSYANLVNVRSSQMPLQLRVAPGDPDASYLIDKLEGTQLLGTQMPQGAAPLPAEDIAVIREWITRGAPPPAMGESALLPARED